MSWGRAILTRLNGDPDHAGAQSEYALKYLGQHFVKSGAPISDFMLLVEDGWRRAWLVSEGGERSFSNDVRRAWKALRREGPLAHLGSQWRCALVLSSIKSLGMKMPRELIVAAVSKKVLTVRQAQHFAELMQDATDSSLTYAALALISSSDKGLQEVLTENALQRALTSPDSESKRSSLFCDLLETLFVPSTLLDDACRSHILSSIVEELKAFEKDETRARVLEALAPHLPPELVTEAFAIVRTIDPEWALAGPIAALAPKLPSALLDQALAVSRTFLTERYKAEALVALLPRLPPDQKSAIRAEALAAARSTNSGWGRTRALLEVAPLMPTGQKELVLVDAIAAARESQDERDRAWALVQLAPELPPELLDEAITVARAISAPVHRVDALAALALQLPPSEKKALQAEAIAGTRAIKSQWDRTKAIAALAPQSAPELLAEMFAAVRTIVQPDDRAVALTALVPWLSPYQREKAVAEAVAFASHMSPRELAGLAPYLPAHQKEIVLAQFLSNSGPRILFRSPILDGTPLRRLRLTCRTGF